MANLSRAASVSHRRMSRVVGKLRACGLVEKGRGSADGPGQIARLTAEGQRKLESAWPVHIARCAFDHLEPDSVAVTAEVLSFVAAASDDG
jgi:DNA-binding MarR family transcriptional regulator